MDTQKCYLFQKEKIGKTCESVGPSSFGEADVYIIRLCDSFALREKKPKIVTACLLKFTRFLPLRLKKNGWNFENWSVHFFAISFK